MVRAQREGRGNGECVGEREERRGSERGRDKILNQLGGVRECVCVTWRLCDFDYFHSVRQPKKTGIARQPWGVEPLLSWYLRETLHSRGTGWAGRYRYLGCLSTHCRLFVLPPQGMSQAGPEARGAHAYAHGHVCWLHIPFPQVESMKHPIHASGSQQRSITILMVCGGGSFQLGFRGK
jgi:hypothetical protein